MDENAFAPGVRLYSPRKQSLPISLFLQGFRGESMTQQPNLICPVCQE